MYDESTLKQLNDRFAWARRTYPHIFQPESFELRALEDMYRLPIMEKEDCFASSLDLVNADHCALMASGGTSGKRTMTLQSLSDFLSEGRIVTDLCSSILPPGKFGFANTLSAGGLWGGGFMLFIASMSHERFVGLNVGNRTPVEMFNLLHGFVTEVAEVEGILLIGLPTTLIEMAKIAITEGKDLRVTGIVYGGEGLEQAQIDYLILAFQPKAGIHAYYSSSEGNCIGFSSGVDNLLLNLVYNSCFTWLMDPDTRDPILETGIPGRIVITNLYASRKPFNFASNDMAIWEEIGKTFRLKGRVQDFVSFGNLGALRFKGQDLIGPLLSFTRATRCQLHIDDQETLRIVIDRMSDSVDPTIRERLATVALDLIFSIAPFANEQLLRAKLKISAGIGEIVTTEVGKTPLVIDHREV